MAYYNSGYYPSSDHGEYQYYQTSYAYNSNDFMTDQDSVAHTSYDDPSFYNLFDYNIPTHYNYSANYNHSYDHNPSWSSAATNITTTAYSVFTPTEPKSIQYYEPNSHHMFAYNHSPQTRFLISYNSVSPELDIPEFEEYDPTPYSGGYDIFQIYGKPLPPSAETCYPHSTKDTKPPAFNAESKEKEKRDPQNGLKPKEAAREEEKRSHENGHGDEINKPETKVEYTNDQDLPVRTHFPSGYGLEATDLCESLFGYWPCFSGYAKRSAMNACHDSGFHEGIRCGKQWNGAADYLFGSSDPYVEKRDGGGSYGLPIHCYQRHYQETPLYLQVEPEEDSWSQNFKIF